MKVKLISCTPDALALLLGTKNTRLKFQSDPAGWTDDVKREHLAYMKDTIKSSWEFVDYVFEVSEVTRAFTHQYVRTRTGSFAQESQRTIDASGNGFLGLNEEHTEVNRLTFKGAAGIAFDAYSTMLGNGVPAQDARGVLPTATFTSIVAKFNLRTLHDMAKLRLCTRTQGEYQDVFRLMRAEVIRVHPWVEEHGFLEVHCVATGTCAFPRFGKTSCQIYDPRMDQSAVIADTRRKFWSIAKQVAVPVAKGGKTM